LNRISKRTQADLAMLIVACIWGFTFVIVKNALIDIGPFLFLGARFLLAFFVLAAVSHRDVLDIHRSTMRAGTWLGLFLFIGYIFQTLGLQFTTSSNAGFVTGVSVVLVPIIYALIYKKRPSLGTTITVLMATTGLYLISVPLGSFSLSYGDLLVLVGAFGFAMHIILVDYHSYQHNSMAITGIQILFVGVLCLAIGLFFEPIPPRLTFNALFAIAVTSVLATALAFLLQNHLQQYSTPTRFAVVLASEPVFAALAGFWWAGERLSKAGLWGAGLILLAMLLSIWFRKKT